MTLRLKRQTAEKDDELVESSRSHLNEYLDRYPREAIRLWLSVSSKSATLVTKHVDDNVFAQSRTRLDMLPLHWLVSEVLSEWNGELTFKCVKDMVVNFELPARGRNAKESPNAALLVSMACQVPLTLTKLPTEKKKLRELLHMRYEQFGNRFDPNYFDCKRLDLSKHGSYQIHEEEEDLLICYNCLELVIEAPEKHPISEYFFEKNWSDSEAELVHSPTGRCWKMASLFAGFEGWPFKKEDAGEAGWRRFAKEYIISGSSETLGGDDVNNVDSQSSAASVQESPSPQAPKKPRALLAQGKKRPLAIGDAVPTEEPVRSRRYV
eukprot:6456942-Amphidinium_carterae.2